MKKTLCALLLTLLLFAVLPAYAEEDVWRTLYGSVPMENAQNTCLADIDFDGTPELWLLRDGEICVYTVQNNQVVALTMQPSSHKTREFTLSLRKKKGGGYVWLVERTLESGGTLTARYYTSKNMVRFSDTFRQDGALFYVNSKKVSKAVYAKKLSSYEKSYPAASYTVVSYAQASSYAPIPAIYPTKITLKKTKLTLSKGAQATLSCSFAPSYCTDRSVTVTSSDDAVVCADGLTITALSTGKATVTVSTQNGITAKCVVTVTAPKPLRVEIASATGEDTVFGKRTLQLTASVYPEDASQDVTWTSSKKSIATVSKTGLVKGIKAGTTTITAKTKNGVKGTFLVTVLKPVSVADVDVSIKYYELTVGETYTLSCTIYPDNATNRTLYWYSDDESIATVDENGVVTGISSGETMITATSVNGLSSGCRVHVYATDSVTRRAFVLGTGNNDYIASLAIDDPEQKANEVWQISQMLQLQTFPTEIEITTLVNPYRASAALNAIANAFKDADEDDVSYLYMVCHGSDPSSGEYELAIGTNGSITGSELRQALQDVKGTVYIFIEACYSGDLIGKGASFDAQAFVDDFAASALSAKSGELAQEKFHVYCSSASTQQSTYFWVDKNRNMSIFGYALSTAGGWEPALYEETSRSVSLAADTDGDECVSEKELVSYLTSKIRNLSKRSQSLCVWPKTAGETIIFRKGTN